jgi:hypothetical protein
VFVANPNKPKPILDILLRNKEKLIISPFKFWTATIFLHAHLQVVYYNCVKFHKTPISRLGGFALTRYTTPLFVKV